MGAPRRLSLALLTLTAALAAASEAQSNGGVVCTPHQTSGHAPRGECVEPGITKPPQRRRVQSPVAYSTAHGWQELGSEGDVRPRMPVAFFVGAAEEEALAVAGGFVEGEDYSLHTLGGRHGGSIVNRQIYHVFPLLSALYPFTWERAFDAGPTNVWMEDNGWFPVAACVLYAAVIVGGQRAMRSRQAFQLRGPLASWNLLLAIFSAVGTIRLVPHALTQLNLEGFHHLVCFDPVQKGGLSGAGGFWTLAFVLSKLPELGDTAWIVLRKRPLIFLHWYHHVTVLLFCWHCYVVRSSLGLPFMAMNYTVHAVMYAYYWASAMRVWPKRISPMFITVLQLLQMAGGVWCCAASAYYKRQAAAEPGQAPCYVANETLLWGGLMYGSYFALFAQFLVQRFVLPLSRSTRRVRSSGGGGSRTVDPAPEQATDFCVGAVPAKAPAAPRGKVPATPPPSPERAQKKNT